MSDSNSKVRHELELAGGGLGRPTVFTFAELVTMPMVQLSEAVMLRTHEDDQVGTWQGPPLAALLERAELVPGAMVVTLRAKDGYEKRVKVEELESAIVALQDGEGRWLHQLEAVGCAIRLVPPKLPGNYWLMNLARITVEPAEG